MSIKSKLKQYPVIVSAYRFMRSMVQWILYTHHCRLNLYKTVLVNFSLLPFRQACRFPIFIYGKVAIYQLSGKAIIDAPTRRGMIKFGNNTDCFGAPNGSAMLSISGIVVFHGTTNISINYAWEIVGTFELGDLVFLGNGVRVRCYSHISIGTMSRITVDSQIFDTNFHYVRKIDTGEVKRADAPIIIGKCSWIGNRSTLMKGAHIPDYSIVAGNSLVNKDMTQNAPLCPMYAGTPAKLITSGYARIFSVKKQLEIQSYFQQNKEASAYYDAKGVYDEYEAVLHDFTC